MVEGGVNRWCKLASRKTHPRMSSRGSSGSREGMFPGRYSEIFGRGERLGCILNLGHSFDAIETYLEFSSKSIRYLRLLAFNLWRRFRRSAGVSRSPSTERVTRLSPRSTQRQNPRVSCGILPGLLSHQSRSNPRAPIDRGVKRARYS